MSIHRIFLVTLFVGMTACNNSKSQTMGLPVDGDNANASVVLLKAKDATVASYKNDGASGSCMVKPGAMLIITAHSNSNVSSRFENFPDNADMYLVKASDGTGLEKIKGAYNDDVAKKSKLVSVLCDQEVKNREYLLICSNWEVLDREGEVKLSNDLCGYSPVVKVEAESVKGE